MPTPWLSWPFRLASTRWSATVSASRVAAAHRGEHGLDGDFEAGVRHGRHGRTLAVFPEQVAGRGAGGKDGRTFPHFDDCRHARGGAAPAAQGDLRFRRRRGRGRAGQGAQHGRARRRPGDAELPDRYPRAQPEDGAVRADLGPPRRNRADRDEQPAVARRGPVPGARRHGGQRALYRQHRGDDIGRGYRQGDRGPVLVPALRPERPGNQPGSRPAGARGGRAGAGAHRRRALARQARARPAQTASACRSG